jgi:hypothetical protein
MKFSKVLIIFLNKLFKKITKTLENNNELNSETITNKPDLETVSSFYQEFEINADFSTNKLFLIALFSDLRNLKKYEEDYQNLNNTLKSLLSGGDQTVKFD